MSTVDFLLDPPISVIISWIHVTWRHCHVFRRLVVVVQIGLDLDSNDFENPSAREFANWNRMDLQGLSYSVDDEEGRLLRNWSILEAHDVLKFEFLLPSGVRAIRGDVGSTFTCVVIKMKFICADIVRSSEQTRTSFSCTMASLPSYATTIVRLVLVIHQIDHLTIFTLQTMNWYWIWLELLWIWKFKLVKLW